MIKKLLRLYRDFMNKPIIHKIDQLNKNLNFLINQTVEMDKVKTLPSIASIQEKQLDILVRLSTFFNIINCDYFLTYAFINSRCV